MRPWTRMALCVCLAWTGTAQAVEPKAGQKRAVIPAAVGAKPPSAARGAAKATGRAGAKTVRPKQAAKPAATSAAQAETGAGPRKLQDIHIEGEIPVPQVLFITAREQRRFMDSQHRRYLRTSREVGEQAVFPTRIAVVGQPPMDARKENTP